MVLRASKHYPVIEGPSDGFMNDDGSYRWAGYFDHACSARRCRGKATVRIGRQMGAQWWLCSKHYQRLTAAETAR